MRRGEKQGGEERREEERREARRVERSEEERREARRVEAEEAGGASTWQLVRAARARVTAEDGRHEARRGGRSCGGTAEGGRRGIERRCSCLEGAAAAARPEFMATRAPTAGCAIALER